MDGTNMAQRIFKDFCDHPKKNKSICDIIFCIQKQVLEKRIRIHEFLEGFDLLHTGTVTINQFERALHNMGVGKHLTQREFRMLCERYLDPVDTNRIMWRRFEDEIDTGKKFWFILQRQCVLTIINLKIGAILTKSFFG